MDQGSLFSLALESPSRCVVHDCGWFSTGVSWCDLVYADCARMVSEASWMITGCLPSGVDMRGLLEGPGCKEAHFIDPLAKQVSLSFWRTSTCTRPLEMCSMFTGGFVQFMDHLWFHVHACGWLSTGLELHLDVSQARWCTLLAPGWVLRLVG